MLDSRVIIFCMFQFTSAPACVSIGCIGNLVAVKTWKARLESVQNRPTGGHQRLVLLCPFGSIHVFAWTQSDPTKRGIWDTLFNHGLLCPPHTPCPPDAENQRRYPGVDDRSLSPHRSSLTTILYPIHCCRNLDNPPRKHDGKGSVKLIAAPA